MVVSDGLGEAAPFIEGSIVDRFRWFAGEMNSQKQKTTTGGVIVYFLLSESKSKQEHLIVTRVGIWW